MDLEGRRMRLMVCSQGDVASVNIRDALLTLADWVTEGTFHGHPVLRCGDLLMVTIEEVHIYADAIDELVEAGTGHAVDEVIFLSRHRAASGKPSLTVHPIGNWGQADYGGREGTLVPPAPHLMTSLLRSVRDAAEELSYDVTFEVTHHGPLLTRPTLFVEIGSGESTWGNMDAAVAIANSLLKVNVQEYPVAIGVGGGHYAPRYTDVALSKRISFGHMLPGYAIDLSDPNDLRNKIEMALSVSGAKLAYIHKKSMKRSEATMVAATIRDLGAEIVDSSDLEDIA